MPQFFERNLALTFDTWRLGTHFSYILRLPIQFHSGHVVSTRTVQTVPWFMANDWGFNTKCVHESSIDKAGGFESWDHVKAKAWWNHVHQFKCRLRLNIQTDSDLNDAGKTNAPGICTVRASDMPAFLNPLGRHWSTVSTRHWWENLQVVKSLRVPATLLLSHCSLSLKAHADVVAYMQQQKGLRVEFTGLSGSTAVGLHLSLKCHVALGRVLPNSHLRTSRKTLRFASGFFSLHFEPKSKRYNVNNQHSI